MNGEKLKSFLDSLSFRDLTLTLDLAITLGILYFYLSSLFTASHDSLSDASFISGLLIQVVFLSIAVSVASALLLEFVGDKESQKPLDEREHQLSLLGSKHALWVLQSGVCIAIVSYAAEAQNWVSSSLQTIPFFPLHVMVVAFCLSEVTNYGLQLIKGRLSASYG